MFGEKGALAYQGIFHILWEPRIISGKSKGTNFKFCTHIHRIDRNKRPLKMSANVAVDVVRDSKNFQSNHIGRIARSSLR